MSNSNNNQINVPRACEAMDKFKMLFCPRSVLTPLSGYNASLSSREAGDLGGRW